MQMKTPSKSRSQVQKEEVLQKLRGVSKVKQVILTQLLTTTFMLLVYGGIVIYVLSTTGDTSDEARKIRILDTWLGWAFAGVRLLPPSLSLSPTYKST
jgi:hypothetical protein